MSEKLKAAIGALYSKDTLYTQQFSPEADKWDSQGVYHKVSRLIGPRQPGSIHVDLGSGKGNLVSRLHQDNPEALVIGIEKNRPLVALAVAEVVKKGLRPKVYDREIVFLNNEGHFVSRHIPLEEYSTLQAKGAKRILEASLQPFLSEDDPEVTQGITFIIDDIRTSDLLKKVSGIQKGRKIDSISITFPGGSSRVAYQAPYSLEKIEKQEMKWRVYHAVEETLTTGFAFAADYLKPGGQLTCVDRLIFKKGYGTPVGDLIKKIKELMGDKADCFSNPTTGKMMKVPLQLPPGGIAWDLQGEMPTEDVELGIVCVQFTKIVE